MMQFPQQFTRLGTREALGPSRARRVSSGCGWTARLELRSSPTCRARRRTDRPPPPLPEELQQNPPLSAPRRSVDSAALRAPAPRHELTSMQAQ
ncbi:Hypothetical predicted protein [Podarcis lilfordi]|uniref:Uncharacterized protein n=1 Tax=Podarcis lilfordi TaxID=74358 RepID=A0AA35KAN3_9SAUR|nr:Hypothetical predicted protein [Podarcis lilfordi]